MRVRGLIAGAALGAVIFVGVAAAYQTVQPPKPGAPRSPERSISLDSAQAADFPVYYAGEWALGHHLAAILRRENHGPIDDIDFIYGVCTAEEEQGCAPPLEVQVWPACVRNLSLYSPSGPVPQAAVPVWATIRGVPAAFFEDFQRLELQTGTATIVIFAKGYEQLIDVAESLRGLNVAVGPKQPLPQPPPEAVAGKLGCAAGAR
jgi:hypothetical protein